MTRTRIQRLLNYKRYIDFLIERELEMRTAAAPAVVADRLFADYERVTRAVRNYASHQPLDLMTPGDIQRDLLAIAGDKHRHRASIGSDDCLVCGRDLRHEVHLPDECTYCGKPLSLNEKQIHGMHVNCAGMDKADHDRDRAKDSH